MPFARQLKSWIKRYFSFLFFSKLEYQLFKKNGEKHNVAFAIHPDDFIYKFIKSHFKKKGGSIGDCVEYYFNSGGESAEKIHGIIKELGISVEKRVFEFASGYGCSTRHLNKYFNNVITCDIHHEANLFNKKNFRYPYIRSVVNPKDFNSTSQYDVIFALSFFSHIPKNNFKNWLIALSKCLIKGGVLIFTTHGSFTKKNFFPNIKLDKDGFWFKESSEQKDLSEKTYGTSISTKEFVEKQIDNIDSLKILKFKEADWWGNQDSYVVKRIV